MVRLTDAQKEQLKTLLENDYVNEEKSLEDICYETKIPLPVVRYYAQKYCVLDCGYRNKLTNEMKQYIRDVCSHNRFLHSKEITSMLNQKFKSDFEYHCVRNLIIKENLSHTDGYTEQTLYLSRLKEEAEKDQVCEENLTYAENIEPHIEPYYVKCENKMYYDVSSYYGI